MIQAQIFTALDASADVIAIAGHRIYPVRLPREAVLPAVVYQIPGVEPVTSMSGDSGIDNNVVQIVSWAKDYSKAHELAFAVRKALVESGLRIITESQNDDEDLETHSYSVILNFRIWSESNIGLTPPESLVNHPVYEYYSYQFVGDGVTAEFTFPFKYRAGSLIIFINGRVAKKDAEYTETPDQLGVEFVTAPAGEPYKDEMLAYYAKY